MTFTDRLVLEDGTPASPCGRMCTCSTRISRALTSATWATRGQHKRPKPTETALVPNLPESSR
jgi:hypothetical protein